MISMLLWGLVGLYTLVVAAWLAATAWVRGFRADETMRLVPNPTISFGEGVPALTVYVAAHNEAERIESCLHRLLDQNYPNLRVLVVNDRSEDETSAVVRSIMANDDRVDLVEVSELPDGWIGKTHALAMATRNATSDYLLFVDCDCRLVPGAIAAIMEKAIEQRLDFVSLWPMLDLASPSERLITPAVSWLLGFYTLLGSKSASDGSQVVLGNGQFMLFSRDAYDRIGGHAAVQAELAEDSIMARRVEQLGLRRWVGWGKGIYLSTRDNSFAATANATTRVVIGSLVKPWRVLCSVHIVMGGTASPLYLGLPAAIAAFIWPQYLQLPAIAIAACIHLVAMRFCIRRLFKMTFLKCPSILSFAVGGLVAALVVQKAYWVIIGRGTVRWGKTDYRVRGSRIVTALPAATGVSARSA
ncbi:MAG: glycosyltransferase [Phycisphaerales bacterium]|nr:glycosyltransferase [Phycisphaerales bacterium]MCB9857166.1 glycosyltransferase [Phycisphaerales bacterium]